MIIVRKKWRGLLTLLKNWAIKTRQAWCRHIYTVSLQSQAKDGMVYDARACMQCFKVIRTVRETTVAEQVRTNEVFEELSKLILEETRHAIPGGSKSSEKLFE